MDQVITVGGLLTFVLIIGGIIGAGAAALYFLSVIASGFNR